MRKRAESLACTVFARKGDAKLRCQLALAMAAIANSTLFTSDQDSQFTSFASPTTLRDAGILHLHVWARQL